LSAAAGKVISDNQEYAQELENVYRQEPYYLDTEEAINFLSKEEQIINGVEF
jgi:hypothetical protein